MTGACPIAAAAAAGSTCRRSRSACGTISAAIDVVRDRPRDPAPRLRSRRHPFRSRQQLRSAATARPRRISAAWMRDRFPALSRRADHLDQGRLRHVAGALRRRGARANICSPASTRASSAWGSTMSTSSIRTGSIPRLRSRRRWARLPAHRQGKALYVGISSYSPELTRKAHGDPHERGRAATHPSAIYSMVNRWIEHGLLDTLGELESAASPFRRSRRECSPTNI